MQAEQHEFIKHRDIHFNEYNPEPNQAQTAALLLADIEGVIRLDPVAPLHLQISYHVLEVTLEQIEFGLVQMGLHLDNSLIFKFKRALCYYTEDTLRANQGCTRGDPRCTRKIFADRYKHLNHDLRDDRPVYWRKYL